MSLMTLINEIGNDADLLTRNDAWLEEERRSVAANLDRNANQLRAILLAQQIKRLLQQKNLVAVQQLVRDENNEVINIIVRILNLPDALAMLQAPQDTLDHINLAAQQSGWVSDGYDIINSTALRRN